MKLKKFLLVASAALMLTSCGGTTYTNENGNTLTLKKSSFVLTTGVNEDNYKVKTVYSGPCKQVEDEEYQYKLTVEKLSISGSCAGTLEEILFTGALSIYGLSEVQIEKVKDGETVTITYEEADQYMYTATVNPEDNTFTYF